jgi:hypothetical protein
MAHKIEKAQAAAIIKKAELEHAVRTAQRELAEAEEEIARLSALQVRANVEAYLQRLTATLATVDTEGRTH